MKKHHIPIFIFLLVVHSVSGQLPPKRYSFTHYGISRGLASNEVSAIIQDDDGYMWIGTNNGLQRFDGVRFLTFRHQKNDPSTIAANYVSQLLIDRKKNLWMQVGGNKTGIFNTSTFTFREVPIRTSNENYLHAGKKIMMDEQGRIMLIIGNLELLTYDEKKNEFSPSANFIPVPQQWGVIDVYQQPGTKKYWVATIRHGLALYDADKKQLSHKDNNAANDPIIKRFGELNGLSNWLMDNKGRLWFDNWESGMPAIYCYDPKKDELVLDKHRLYPMVYAYHEVGGFLMQKNGTIWTKGLGIFVQFLEKEKLFQPVYNGFENEQSIAYGRVNSLYEDREQNLWVGTANNGLYRFNPAEQFFTNIRQIDREKGRPGDGSMMSFVHTRDGTILAGAWGNGIYRFDKDFNMLPLNIKGLKENASLSCWGMVASKDSNTIWMAAQPGILQIDQKARTAVHHNPPFFKERTMRQVAEDKHGNLWIGSQSLGLIKWDKEKGKNRFEDGLSILDGIPGGMILKVFTDRQGYIWAGVAGWGVWIVDPNNDKIVMHFGTKEPEERRLLWDGAASIVQYDDTTIVIAAEGLHVYNTKLRRIIKTIPLPESIPGNLASMEKDREGYLWVSTTSGIFRVNLKNKIFIHFDRIDGIANDYFITAASHTLPDGRMLFGADNQLVAFNPSEVRINDPSPAVTITEFNLRNKPLRVDSLRGLHRVELAPEDNSISIGFSGLTYNGTYIIKYKLEGLDKEWKVADNTHQAIYSYLPPGTYTFLLQSEDAEGNPGKEITRLVIKVKPPFWKTWWFLGIIIFAATAVLFWLDKIRMRRLRETESIRTRIATSLTEDMSNSLTNINISSELAKTKIDVDRIRTKEYIGQISETSNRMVQAMYDMVWSIDPKNDTMADTIDRMKSFAAEAEGLYPINIDFDFDNQVSKLALDMELRYEMLSIFKEALTNAAKHSGGRYVKITIRYNNSRLMMMVIDDGKGFSMDEASMLGRGISDMRRRSGAINASLYIESEINTGTVVKLELEARAHKNGVRS